MLCALIMAGGKGTRFWPLSTEEKPKQFLKLLGDETMIQMTVNRIKSIIPMERIFICTVENYVNLVKEQLPDIPQENIIVEPEGRNTAPCITLSALIIERKYKNSTMIVLPADHLIKEVEKFRNIILNCNEFLNQNSQALITLGMKVDRAETGYGYIKTSKEYETLRNFKFIKVEEFKEKPNQEKADEYLKCGDYLWNSGIFMWKAKEIINRIKKYKKNIYLCLKEIESIDKDLIPEFIKVRYKETEKISIDYAVLEKSDDIYVIPSSIGWDDIGTWKAVERYKKKDSSNNIIDGNAFIIESKSNIALNNRKRVIMIGIEDIVTLETKNEIYIINKNYMDKLSNYKNSI